MIPSDTVSGKHVCAMHTPQIVKLGLKSHAASVILKKDLNYIFHGFVLFFKALWNHNWSFIMQGSYNSEVYEKNYLCLPIFRLYRNH